MQLELFPTTATEPNDLLARVAVSVLRDNYYKKVRQGRGRGVDGVDTRTFESRLLENLETISRKVADDTYRFTYFAEHLRLKGRREPRVISIPTLRDRLVLFVLKEVLHAAFPECVPRRLPNTHIRHLASSIAGLSDINQRRRLRCDIKDFYGSIGHNELRARLKGRLGDGLVTRLVMRAVATPTVPRGTRAKATVPKNRVGVPQGLAISNILAAIYAAPIDETMGTPDSVYDRYVDDIILIAKDPAYVDEQTRLYACIRNLGLELNPEKTSTAALNAEMDFLGYRILWPTITVRPSSVDRFLASIAARLTSYRRGEAVFREKYPWVNKQMYREVLVEDLNERITGATSGVKRYGWLFYFLEINDTALLDQMDAAIQQMVTRVPEFSRQGLPGLKKLKKAYYEAKYDPRGRYIMQYDSISTLTAKLAFLEKRGHLRPGGSLPPDEVDRLFDRVRLRRLARLDADVTSMS